MDIQNFERLEILSLRDNDLVAIPEEIAKLTKIHELHLQVNFVTLSGFNLVTVGKSTAFTTTNILPSARQFYWPEKSAQVGAKQARSGSGRATKNGPPASLQLSSLKRYFTRECAMVLICAVTG